MDRITRLAAASLVAPMSLLSIVAPDRQCITSAAGLEEQWASLHVAPLPHSLQRYAAELAAPLAIEVAQARPALLQPAMLLELGIAACAGAPILSADGQVLGTLWVMDRRPRGWSPAQLALLADLAALAGDELARRAEQAGRRRDERDVRTARERLSLGVGAETTSISDQCTRTGEMLHHAGAGLDARQALLSERSDALAVLHESEERFRNAFEYAGIGMALVGLDGRWHRVNRALCRITGYSEAELAQRTFQDITHPDDLVTDLALLERLATGEIESYEMEKRYLHKQGHAVSVLLTASMVRDGAGRPLHFVAQIQDVSRRKAAEAAQARLSAIVETMPDMVAICGPDGRVSYLNATGRRLLGFGDAQPDGLITVGDVQPQFAPGGTLSGAVPAMRRDGIWRGETTLLRADGREMPVEEILLAHPPEAGEAASITAILRDISERKHTETTLRSLALMDELTGLYNRRGFLALAEEELRRAQRDGWPTLLFYGDLDAFKAINDSYGHAEGDRALADAAALLRAVFRESDVIGRIGGDEFTMLVAHGTPGTEALIRERLERRFAAFNETAGRPYSLSLSLGVAECAPSAARSLADLFAEADAALLRGKRERRTG